MGLVLRHGPQVRRAREEMSRSNPSTGTAGSRKRETLILLGMGLAALAPYVLYHRLFLQMYWFGDEG
jgi:hypothetical protein